MKYIIILLLLLLLLLLLILLNTKSGFGLNNKIGVYVVSMERAKERKAHLAEMFKGFKDYTLFKAVDGYYMTPEDTSLKNEYIKSSNFTQGEVGCALSHFKLWQHLENTDFDTFLILEDDFIPKYPMNDILEIIKQVNNYDILYTGHCLEEQGKLVQTVEYNNKEFKIYDSVKPLCTHSYVLTKQGIKKVLNYTYKHKIRAHIDHHLNNMRQQGVIKGLTIFDPLVEQPWQKENFSTPLKTYIRVE
jgi:glycosyl transferase family 25